MSESSAKAVPADEEVPNARRDFLKIGLAAAAAATAAGVVSKPQEAEAANGGNMIIGAANAGTLTTSLSGSQFSVTNGNGGRSIYGSHIDDGNGVVGENFGSTTAAGAGVVGRGNGFGSVGVLGQHFGTSTIGGTGVRGSTDGFASTATVGRATGANSHGVRGEATAANSVGLVGASTLGAALQLGNAAFAVPPTSGSWSPGQFLVKDGQLWFCVTGGSGTASKWVRVSSPFVPLGIPKRAATQSTFHNAGSTKTKSLSSAVPAGATAVVLNVMLLDTKGKGQLSIIGANRSFSGTFANISWWGKDQRPSNTTVSNVSSDRKIKVKASGTGGAKYAIDVIGYYV